MEEGKTDLAFVIVWSDDELMTDGMLPTEFIKLINWFILYFNDLVIYVIHYLFIYWLWWISLFVFQSFDTVLTMTGRASGLYMVLV